jgi:acyl-CoA hydrolase
MMAEWFQPPGVCPWSAVARLVDVIGYLPVQGHLGPLYRGLTASIIRFRCFQPVPRWQILRVSATLCSVGRTSVMSQVVGHLTPILEPPTTDTRHGEHEATPCLMIADGIVTVGLQWSFQRLAPGEVLPPWTPDSLHLQDRARVSEQLKADYFSCRGDLPPLSAVSPLASPFQVAAHHLNVHERAFGGFMLATMLDAWWGTYPSGGQPPLLGMIDMRFLVPVLVGDTLQVQTLITGAVSAEAAGVSAHEVTLLVTTTDTGQTVASCRVWAEGPAPSSGPWGNDAPRAEARFALLMALTPDETA